MRRKKRREWGVCKGVLERISRKKLVVFLWLLSSVGGLSLEAFEKILDIL